MKKMLLGLAVLSASSFASAESRILCKEVNSAQARTVLISVQDRVSDGVTSPGVISIFGANRKVLASINVKVETEDVFFSFKGRSAQGANKMRVGGYLFLDEMDQAGMSISVNGLRQKLRLDCNR